MRPRHVLPVAAALVLVTADPAAATSFTDSGYALHLRAAAVSVGLGPAAPGAGVSVVDLAKEAGHPVGRCGIIGAGAYTDDLLRRMDKGDYPYPRPHDDDVVPVPTAERDEAPNLSPGGSFAPRRPDPTRALRDPRRTMREFGVNTSRGPGVRWFARCDNDAAGRAVASNGDLPGVEAAGSVASARVDRATMGYLGTARAFVAGVVTPVGSVDAISSFMTIASTPGREPAITYRVTVTDGSTTSVLAWVTDAPVSQLAAQVNDFAAAAGPYGLSLLGPSVATDDHGTWTVQAPFLELRTGDVTTRLVAVSFSGRS